MVCSMESANPCRRGDNFPLLACEILCFLVENFPYPVHACLIRPDERRLSSAPVTLRPRAGTRLFPALANLAPQVESRLSSAPANPRPRAGSHLSSALANLARQIESCLSSVTATPRPRAGTRPSPVFANLARPDESRLSSAPAIPCQRGRSFLATTTPANHPCCRESSPPSTLATFRCYGESSWSTPCAGEAC